MLPTKTIRTVLCGLLCFVISVSYAATETNHGFIDRETENKHNDFFWDQVYPDPFPANTLKPQDTISVKGNQFLDENGQTFRFIGMSIADPAKLFGEKRWGKRLFQEVKNWGANTIRLPIHPLSWRERGRDWYIQSCLLYTSPSPRDRTRSRMPSSA